MTTKGGTSGTALKILTFMSHEIDIGTADEPLNGVPGSTICTCGRNLSADLSYVCLYYFMSVGLPPSRYQPRSDAATFVRRLLNHLFSTSTFEAVSSGENPYNLVRAILLSERLWRRKELRHPLPQESQLGENHRTGAQLLDSGLGARCDDVAHRISIAGLAGSCILCGRSASPSTSAIINHKPSITRRSVTCFLLTACLHEGAPKRILMNVNKEKRHQN